MLINICFADCDESFIVNEQYPANGPECFPLEFSYYSSTQLGYYYFIEVTVNDYQISSEDWVGAFNDDVCVGSRLWGDCSDGGGCDVPVLGSDGSNLTQGYMSNGVYPDFKIYDVSENIYIDATPSESIAWYPFTSPIIDLLYSNADIQGCMDQFACNQDPYANIDDGTCEYCSCDINPDIVYQWDQNNDGVLDNYNAYEFNGSLTSLISFQDTTLSILNEDDMLVAFVDSELRGVGLPALIPFGPYENSYQFQMMIYSNVVSGEILTFKYYNSESNRIYCLNETLEFTSNMTVGDVLDPFIFSISDTWLSNDGIPKAFSITSIYPNPFNPNTTIDFSIEESSLIEFLLYDSNGRVVEVINKDYYSKGTYSIYLDNVDLSTGSYFIVMTNGIDKYVRKVTFLK